MQQGHTDLGTSYHVAAQLCGSRVDAGILKVGVINTAHPCAIGNRAAEHTAGGAVDGHALIHLNKDSISITVLGQLTYNRHTSVNPLPFSVTAAHLQLPVVTRLLIQCLDTKHSVDVGHRAA